MYNHLKNIEFTVDSLHYGAKSS